MSKPVRVEIIGAPIACAEGIKDTWREVAGWAEGQLIIMFGDSVQVTYYDLFDADCAPVPAGVQLPLVLVNGDAIISGGKIAIPVIRQSIEAILAKELVSR